MIGNGTENALFAGPETRRETVGNNGSPVGKQGGVDVGNPPVPPVGPGGRTHGLDSTYNNGGCRCGDCTHAHRLAYRDRRDRERGLGSYGDIPMRPWVDHSWHDDALCADQPKALFFPDENTNPVLIRRAVLICQACPVIDQCRRAARDEPVGIWAGETHRLPKVAQRHYRELIGDAA